MIVLLFKLLVSIVSSGINETSVPNEMTTYIDLATLRLRSGLHSNVTLQAVNDVGASNHSNPVEYNVPILPSGKLSQTIQ